MQDPLEIAILVLFGALLVWFVADTWYGRPANAERRAQRRMRRDFNRRVRARRGSR